MRCSYPDHETQRALNYLTLLMDNLSLATSFDQLWEYSEEADGVYYNAVTSLLKFHHPYSHFQRGRIGGLFNPGYQLLHQHIHTLLDTSGLHPHCALLHRNVHHELPLAWDFTAEFRTAIVDDLVLHFAKKFPHTNGNGNGNSNGKSQPRTIVQHFLQHWEAKLKTFVLHPQAGTVSYRQCMDFQVREYLGYVLSDVEYYRPLALKFHPLDSKLASITKPQKASLTVVK
ncbi:CRISPR-associated endonuclease Cas1 [Umezakia ovalisporum]|uniref:CRISPR-associated endonuclease Cas1 n=2 Tax=Umezakia ovalisporum TaxID=75695 RepID=A0AA43KFC6_9CYAN|nr:CRISPR-associated endonuclease Cas1 [Umezakia ovalisporum]MDH6058089.1 CRISPR-associated endonuclease Cas1 [Umezakia ovalisporum FSS-43]MDH6064679.1 CRISPR-associated endonuclease Cas1 [Umezakia ovalisporum FSS-62]MDH6071578.1 CRISPR-associated endonuclease Cas1 [Umezakia ovalisporum CobakiLakeA]MDH6073060.1 CRISPR-associated endonuclease Cas1 [Umezakia ovalisporum CS-1034]MDH6078231.1 CRISPR-associated endonuclease Cas1 [Umezakia ovalisporum FSS-45]